VDHNNHCLRSINRRTRQTSPYAGRCEKAGFADGQLIGDAMFDHPWAIAYYKGQLFVTDSWNLALRLVAEGRVSTIIKGSSMLSYPHGLTLTEDGNAFITSSRQGLLRLNLLSQSVTELTNGIGPAGSLSAAQLSGPYGLTFLSPSFLLIADSDKDQLLLTNIRNNTITEICDGTRGTRNGDIRSCQLYYPYSVLMANQSVFVGQDGAIRRLSVAALSEVIQTVESSTETPGENDPPPLYHMFMPLLSPMFDFIKRITSHEIIQCNEYAAGFLNM